MVKLKMKQKHLLIPLAFFILNLLVQNWNLAKLMLPGSDEGVYLYSAKLMGQGLFPYKDYFLAHPPFLVFLARIMLWVSCFNINVFHFLYTVMVFSAIFPIYLITFKLTKDEFASITSVIFFSTYPIFVSQDAHFFTLRQLSTSLLAFSVFFLLVKNKYKLAGFLLGLFSLSVISNIFISLAFIFSYLKKKDAFPFLKSWLLMTLFGYFMVLLIPQSFQNIISFQLQRSYVSFFARIESMKSGFFPLNWPLLLFGFLGSIFAGKNLRFFSLFNILSFLCLMFLGSSFHSHYLAILSFGFSVASGFLIFSLKRFPVFKILFFIIIVCLDLIFLPYLKSKLIDETTPEFFRLSAVLKNVPSPIFTYQPIYGLYNRKELTFHYYVADMRYFSVIGQNLDEKTYTDIINKSNSVLLTSFDFLSLPENVFRNVNKNFKLLYNKDGNKVYIRIK